MPNLLQHAKSPYLKQHQLNPVEWHEWGQSALDKAKSENKIILVSIGYSACHWCHVMAHESFEDEETAKIMNTHFVNIKIDREERPDLDAIYMDACQLVTGKGGWPLNAFALPDGTPFHAGTYFPKPQWHNILNQIALLWEKEPHKVNDYASDLKKGIQSVSQFVKAKDSERDIVFQEVFNTISTEFDTTFGGLKHAPKFPMPTLWNFILNSKNDSLISHALFTLEQINLGGIYDWVEGGFARYSVDEKWFAPHFEKMLYDNAQMISLNAKAYAITGNSQFMRIAEESAAFVMREWISSDGGYYSAYDADSEGIEGKYYCLTSDDIASLSIPNKNLFKQFFQITNTGNWEHGMNILYPLEAEASFGKKNGLNQTDFNSWKQAITKFRSFRIKPGLDDKQNSSWNGLMLSAFAHLHQVSSEQKWELAAKSLFDYLAIVPYDAEHTLQHMVHNSTAYIAALSEDYAHIIAGMLDYFEAASSHQALVKATQLMNHCFEKFYDRNSGFFNMSAESNIIETKIEVTDNVIPSSNSVMCENLLKLGVITENNIFFEQGEHMLNQMNNRATKHPQHYSNWCKLLLLKEKGYPYVISNSKLINDLSSKLWMNLIYTPELGNTNAFKHKIFSKNNTYYYCANKVCQAPVYNEEDIAL